MGGFDVMFRFRDSDAQECRGLGGVGVQGFLVYRVLQLVVVPKP